MAHGLTLQDVLAEVLAEKARVLTVARGQTPGAKVEIYGEAWRSLNSWIESRLCKRKGASVPMLGSFTWEVKYGGDGNVYSRPIFIMSDSFIKEHRIRRQRVHAQPDLVPPEEINYSKLAIKFSKALTKDMIFTGTRDIIKKIGDFIDRGYEFEVEFAFGALKSKERVVRFEFNQARLAAILPENLRIGTMPQQPMGYDALSEGEASSSASEALRSSASSNNNDDDRLARVAHSQSQPQLRPLSFAASSASSAANTEPLRATSATSSLFSHPYPLSDSSEADLASRTQSAPALAQAPSQENLRVPLLALPLSGGGSFSDDAAASAASSPSRFANTATVTSLGEAAGNEALALTMAASQQYFPGATANRPVSPGLIAVLTALEEHKFAPPVNKVELRNRACARVEEAAYLRTLEHVGSEATFEEKTQEEAASMISEFEVGVKAKIENFHKNKKHIKSLLDEQIKEVEARVAQQRQEQRDMKAAFFLPDSAGAVDQPPGYGPGAPTYKTIKANLHRDLTRQINFNATRTQIQKEQDLQEEKDYLDHVAMELDLQNIAERVSHLEKQKALLASWERDAHIRNLRKLQVAGSGAVKDYISVNLPEAAAQTKRPSVYSIGYDYRKGRPSQTPTSSR